jgi:hypothetical protein
MNAFSPPQDSSSRGVLDNHMSIQAAAEYSGYNLQYLRRIVRKGEVEGVKVGQVWLVDLTSLDCGVRKLSSVPEIVLRIGR